MIKMMSMLVNTLITITLASALNATLPDTEKLDLSNARAHVALPIKNLEQTKAFYMGIFDAEALAYGRSPNSTKNDLLLVNFGPIALSFNEVHDLSLSKHFTMPSGEKLDRSFVGAFHFGLFELSEPQFETIKKRVQQFHADVLESVFINQDTPNSQKLMFIKDPDGYVIELRKSGKLSPSVAQKFEQQNENNTLSKTPE